MIPVHDDERKIRRSFLLALLVQLALLVGLGWVVLTYIVPWLEKLARLAGGGNG